MASNNFLRIYTKSNKARTPDCIENTSGVLLLDNDFFELLAANIQICPAREQTALIIKLKNLF